jgi:arylsulfatase A-like enzyme/Tfp pilus assembly protein PilF
VNVHRSSFVVHRFLLALIIGITCARRESPKPNVLLITLDTFRADRVGPLTPALKALAARSVVFENADSAVPLTLPSHATILSGLLPLHHGLRLNGVGSFPERRDTLATLFSRSGYRTGALVSAFVLDHRFGLNRGFETYDDGVPRDPTGEAPTLEAERRGGETTDRAIEWIRGQGERRWFAWVHLYDAHAPYAPPSPYPQSYDGEIAYVDAQVGRLLSSIDSRKTIVVVVGDHGEALGEHGELTHGLLLYEPTLHVPMIIAAPASKPRVVRDPVSTADIAPTIAALAGIPMTNVDGHPVPGEARSIYAETQYPTQFGWSDLAALRRGPMKFVSAPNRELYDLAHDPGETVNLLKEDRRTFRDLETALSALRRTQTNTQTFSAVDEETRAKLASLGYVAPTSGPGGAEPRDPKVMVPLFRRFEEATWALNGGRPKQALEMLETLVRDDPANPVFRQSLARMLRQHGQLERAIELYRQAVAIAPNDADAWYSLATALQEAGHTKEGGVAIREALRRDALRPEAHNALGIAYSAEGDLRSAEREFRVALGIDPQNARAYNNLGNTLRAMNRFDEAREAFRRAIALAPTYADPLNGLGVIDVQQDRPREAIAEFDAALRLAPNYYEALLNRGIALRMSGDSAAAADQFRHLLTILPKSAEFDAQRNAARALLIR